ncbi:MAG: response regulator with CheY-like receiver, AAA-type ATPase, and DNA-binding domain [Planctomycetota bacterium]|nr:response regulator with CheY-like receiver, AAA-type ATPase, and DNA-binding domain [Planctomycetota bacterium]
MTSLRASGVRRLNALLQQSREPVFVIDPQGRFVFVNRAWEELTGHSAERTLGGTTIPVGASSATDSESAFFPPAEAFNGVPSGGINLIVREGGERLWRRVEFWPYHDPEGKLLGIFGLVRDVNAHPHAPEAESLKARSELLEAREALRLRHGFDTLVGRGPRHERLLEQITAAASSRAPVLLVGEPGTGKRQIARILHQRGSTPDAPLVPIDVSALSADVVEKELFFPQVDGTARLGLPEDATLSFGDLVDLPRDLQARLATAIRGSSIRLIARTCVDPEQAARDDRLRSDLYYTLTVLVLRLAPLRERIDELPLLAQHFLEVANRRGPGRRSGFHPETLEVLAAYDWPGNLRELARVIESAHGRGETDRITAEDLPAAIRGDLASSYAAPMPTPAITPLDLWLTQLERRLIEQALQRARQNKSRAAELLDISRPRLYRRIKELNIPDEGDAAEDVPAESR